MEHVNDLYCRDIYKSGLWDDDLHVCDRLGKSYSFALPRMPFVNCCQFINLVISLLVLRAGYGI